MEIEVILNLSANALRILLYYLTFIMFSGKYIKFHKFFIFFLLFPEVIIYLSSFFEILGFNGVEPTLVSEINKAIEYLFVQTGILSHNNNPQIIQAYWVGALFVLSTALKVFKPNSIPIVISSLLSLSVMVSIISFHAIIVNSANVVHQAKLNHHISFFMQSEDFIKDCNSRGFICVEGSNITPTDTDLLPIHNFHLNYSYGYYANTLITIVENNNSLKTIGYFKDASNNVVRTLIAYNIDIVRFNFIKALFYILAIVFAAAWIIVVEFLLTRHKISF